jgi:hypothetical protein
MGTMRIEVVTVRVSVKLRVPDAPGHDRQFETLARPRGQDTRTGSKNGGQPAAILLNNLAFHYDKLANQAARKDKSPTN